MLSLPCEHRHLACRRTTFSWRGPLSVASGVVVSSLVHGRVAVIALNLFRVSLLIRESWYSLVQDVRTAATVIAQTYFYPGHFMVRIHRGSAQHRSRSL